jgi:hypothetical protein
MHLVAGLVACFSLALLVAEQLDSSVAESEILSASSWPVDISFIPDIYDLDDADIDPRVVEMLDEIYGEDN